MNKENKNFFDPIKSKNINDDIKTRAAFWDAYSKNFISISYAKLGTSD